MLQHAGSSLHHRTKPCKIEIEPPPYSPIFNSNPYSFLIRSSIRFVLVWSISSTLHIPIDNINLNCFFLSEYKHKLNVYIYAEQKLSFLINFKSI